METVTTLLEDWNSFAGVNVTEEAHFMSQLLDNFPLPNDSLNDASFKLPSTFLPHHELNMSVDEVDEISVYFSDNTNSNLNSFDDGSTLFPTSSGADYPTIDCSRDVEKSITSGPLLSKPTKNNKLSESFGKRSCSMVDLHENREKIKCRKSQKLVSKCNEGEADHDAVFGEIMNIYGSDEDSNWSQESSISPRPKDAAIPNLNGKTKANRGSATDPQSVYARKRRERINERLRILQNLVPNGTKVDISTMLEEAVRYVKFLQLQIKLLSSDDLWMYAPIAYNGLDIGLDLTIPSPR